VRPVWALSAAEKKVRADNCPPGASALALVAILLAGRTCSGAWSGQVSGSPALPAGGRALCQRAFALASATLPRAGYKSEHRREWGGVFYGMTGHGVAVGRAVILAADRGFNIDGDTSFSLSCDAGRCAATSKWLIFS
jgi:hypothetical protein